MAKASYTLVIKAKTSRPRTNAPSQRNNRRRMTSWSAENATKAYLRALKMGKRGKEPDVAEFISALAAGNNAQLMVMACAGFAGSTALALVAAAHQTDGRLVCIFRNLKDFHASEKFLKRHEDIVEFVVGDARKILLNNYRGVDFVLIDFNIEDHEGIFLAARRGASNGGALVVGTTPFHKGPWLKEVKGHFLPIGEGLVVTRIPAGWWWWWKEESLTHWIVRVDECTGEEHFYRFTSSCRKQLGT